MPDVRIHDGALRRAGQRIGLLMGEMHYWRLNPHRWPVALRAMKRLGLDVVATYVPWQYHELAPGRFDFQGETEEQRNLVGFLDLVHAEGFHCFIRPGPYIYSEWTNAGVPDRVVGLPRLSEAYRAEALAWMRAVIGVLRPYFATDESRFAGGGPIVLFQPDNEADLFSHWFEKECGLDGPAESAADPRIHGRFLQQFLRDAYASVDDLNQAWGTAYDSIDQVQPAAVPIDWRDPGALARARDYWRFQHWATTQIVAWHAREYRRLGVDLPMVANYYPGGDVQNWRVLAGSGGVDLLGIDWYPRNEFTGPPPPPGSSGASGGGGIFGLPPHREHRVFLDSCRMQRAVSPVPFIAELECGVWHGYEAYTGSFSPNHYRLLACSALLAGIKGWNWYMFVGRDNWCFSPVNERGDLRPELAGEFLAIHRVWRELDPPTLIPAQARIGAYLECEQIATDDLLADNPVLQALYDARCEYDVWDAESLARAADPPPLLFYAAADWLDRSKQEVLRRYAEQGGRLVLFTTYPRRDERFRPHDGLGLRMPDRVLSRLGKKVEVAFGEVLAAAEGPVWVWDSVPSGATALRGTQVAGRQQAIENADVWMRNYIGKEWTVGYRQPLGRGEIVVIGLPPSPDVAWAVATSTVAGAVRAQAAGVQVAMFRRSGPSSPERFLIAANLNQHPVQTRLNGLGGGQVLTTDLFSGQEERSVADQAVLSLGRASGGAWRLSPA